MKKSNKYLLLCCTILFALFNVIVFIIPSSSSYLKFGASFWIGYATVCIATVLYLLCNAIRIKKEKQRETLYESLVFIVSTISMIVVTISAIICIAVSTIVYWVSVIICALFLSVGIIITLLSVLVKHSTISMDKKVQAKTSFIYSMRAETKNLLESSHNEEIKKICHKVFEDFNYSDPVSMEELQDYETSIEKAFEDFKSAVLESKLNDACCCAEVLTTLLISRNNKCKIIKNK
jgi:vacuolar-type H+-ATPase subunit I/STV1